MYLVADINVEICAAKSCKLCTQYCPEANTILYSDEMGKDKGFKYGSAYVAVDRCKGCAQCVWVCDNMAKNNAIKMIMIDQLPKAALTDNVTYSWSGGFSSSVRGTAGSVFAGSRSGTLLRLARAERRESDRRDGS
jgi:Pyruvate/2-oxoacid:ferredoxin oxidoreductase delta subunit